MVARTVLHGVDQSCPTYAKLPAKAHHGALCVTEDNGTVWRYDGTAAQWRPLDAIHFIYDVAEHGGAVGSIALPVKVPANTLITHGILEVIEAPESSGSATVAISVTAANDIKTATAIASLTLGAHAIAPLLSNGSTAVRTTADKAITVTIGTADLTAGKIRGTLYCSPSEPQVTTTTTAAPTTTTS